MKFMYVVLAVLIATYLAVPILLISGWVKWVRQPQKQSPILPLISLATSSASGVLALATVAYARIHGGFRYYDPSLMRIFACGLLLSLIASALAIARIRKPDTLRWYAVGSSIGMFFMWFIWAGME